LRIIASDRYALALPTVRGFPASKYAALRRRLEDQSLAGAPFEFIEPHADKEGEAGELGEIRRCGLAQSSVTRSRSTAGKVLG